MDNRTKKNKNNTHAKAAALEYDINKDNAPKIVASGEGELARKLLETARKNDIPIKENQDIVNILVRLNIGEEIPPELYEAVAEILSFIYSLDAE